MIYVADIHGIVCVIAGSVLLFLVLSEIKWGNIIITLLIVALMVAVVFLGVWEMYSVRYNRPELERMYHYSVLQPIMSYDVRF